MNFYIFLLFFASSYALDFNCLKGPKYWCTNLENAQKCGRVTECFMINKNKGVTKMSNGQGENTCDLCKQVITELEQQFLPNMTEQQFIDFVLKNVCSKLDDKLKALCIQVVPQYGHYIYNALKAYLDPANVCSGMGVCPRLTIMPTIVSSPETCKVCKEAFAFLESLLASITPAELKNILKLAICNQLPSVARTMCDTLVDGYTDQLYQLLKSLLDGDRVCPALHFCSSQVRQDNVAISWNCQACVDVVTVLRKDLANVTPAEAEDLIKTKVCEKVPFLVRGFCNENVDKYVPLFFNDLHSQLTPEQICAKNTVCVSPPSKVLKPTISTKKQSLKGVVECDACEMVVSGIRKLLLTKAGELKVKNFIKTRICTHFGSRVQKCVEFVDTYGDILIKFINTELTSRQICELFGACAENSHGMAKIQSKKLGGVECEACQLVLGRVKAFISDPTRETNFKNYLKNSVCPLFGKENLQCQQVLDEYFNIIFNAIISEMDVDKICVYLKYCSAITVVKSPATIKCDVCEAVMAEIIDMVTTNASQQRVLEFLTTEICPKLGILNSECNSVVGTYLPYLFQIARTSLNSKILCARLHLCTVVSQKNIEAMLKSLKIKSFQCDLCQFAVNETRALLSDTTVQTLLENFLKQEICPHFGAQAQECVNDINQYYSFIINIILEFATPSLCSEIRLCASKKVLTNTQRHFTNLIKAKKVVECEICPLFYKFLKTVTVKTPNNDIVLGLVSICGGYYHEDKTKCLNLLKKMDTMFVSLTNAKNEKEFCELSRMCSAVHSSPLLGQKKCSWGPGFWCLSRRHAEFCGIGAVRHCELKVWRGVPIL